MTVAPSTVALNNAPVDACDCGPSRRRFLGAAGLTLAGSAGLFGAGTWTRTARAATPNSGGDVLVVLSLHGGIDGLSVAAPVADPDYRALRPNIAIPASQAIQLDATFGMHPALAPLKARVDAGQFGIVHGVGAIDRSRSHFESMDHLERADAGSSVRTGWLNRVVGLQDNGPWGATQMGSAVRSGALAGPAPVMSLTKLADATFAGAPAAAPLDRWDTALAALHSGYGSPLAVPTASAFSAVRSSQTISTFRKTSASYPATPLGTALADVAAVIRSDELVRVAVVDSGDWDHHVDLSYRMGENLAELGSALAAFADDLGSEFARVTVVTVSEFGRRAAENGTGGADHGHGNAVMVLSGSGLKRSASPVYGRWPGLGADQLDDGDLAGTSDYRDVLAEALTRRCGVPVSQLAAVFPGYTPRAVEAFATRS